MDIRDVGPPTTTICMVDEEGYDVEVKLPTHKAVCPCCNGTGKHVNANIDRNGLTAEDFAEDPDFYEEYMTGVYDVRCTMCNGQNVVDEVDYDALTPELKKAYDEWCRQERIDRENSEMWARMHDGYY